MPPVLEEGVLYISTEYYLMAHLCASGCGEKVVLPLHPSQWRFTYDGDSVSVSPSVGNVGLRCNAHYWITRGQIEWSDEITAQQARARHLRDRRDLEASNRGNVEPETSAAGKPSLWQRITRFFKR